MSPILPTKCLLIVVLTALCLPATANERHQQLELSFSVEVSDGNAGSLLSVSTNSPKNSIFSITGSVFRDQFVQQSIDDRGFITHLMREYDSPLDRVYPGFVRVADGVYVVNLDYFITQQPFFMHFNHVIDPVSFECVDTLTISEGYFSNPNNAMGRYLVLTTDKVHCLEAQTQIAQGILLGDSLLSDISNLVEEINQQEPGAFPLVILSSYWSTEAFRWQSDMGWNNTVFARFYGDHSSVQQSLPKLHHMLVHEAKHARLKSLIFVHGGKPRSSPSWVMEGDAEYQAIKSLYADGNYTQAEVWGLISASIDGCIRQLFPYSLLSYPKAMMGKLPYDCGTAIMYFLDISTNGPEALQTNKPESYLWLQNGRFGFEQTAINAIVEKLISGGQFSFTDAQRVLRSVGVTAPLNTTSDNDLYVNEIILNILSNDCTQSYGYWGQADHIILDAANCKTIKHRSRIDSLDGLLITQSADQLYRGLHAECGMLDSTDSVQLKDSNDNLYYYRCH